MTGKVTFSPDGRMGRVRYTEGPFRVLDGYFEFGGHDVVAIISFGDEAAWRRAHPWAAGRRDAILHFIARELVRTQAPGTVPDVDPATGIILLRTSASDRPAQLLLSPERPPSASQKAEAFFWRFNRLRSAAAKAVLLASLVFGGAAVLGQSMLERGQPPGTPLNASVRHDAGVATLIQRTDPQLPRWSGRGGGETVSVSLLDVPLSGPARLIRLVRSVEPGQVSLARVLGSDGTSVWADVGAIYGVRLRDGTVLTAQDLRHANPDLEPGLWDDQRQMDVSEGRLRIAAGGRAFEIDPVTLRAQPAPARRGSQRPSAPEPAALLAAGLVTSRGDWLGLMTARDRASAFGQGSTVGRIEDAASGNTERFLTRARLSALPGGRRFRIRETVVLSQTAYINAGFLRATSSSEPVRLQGPPGALFISTRPPVLTGVLTVSRVDEAGLVAWTADTGLDRFSLRQILTGDSFSAFVGSRPPQPGKLSEPLLVLVSHDTGTVRTETLWR
jgi:hypothetical protein